MIFVDVVVILVLLVFAVKGMLRGLVNELSSLLGLALGSWLAFHYYTNFATLLSGIFPLPGALSGFLGFMGILLLTGIVSHIIGNVVTVALRLIMLGGVNRLGGILLGAAEGVLLVSLFCYAATTHFMPVSVAQKITASESARFFAIIGDTFLTTWRNNGQSPP